MTERLPGGSGREVRAAWPPDERTPAGLESSGDEEPTRVSAGGGTGRPGGRVEWSKWGLMAGKRGWW